ncbi:MAG: CHAT domain-containing protein [Propionibacteriaceae bacterium]|nr:CHAT domain-containing protein [Propionibacteriaceae bacterium]
MTLSAQELYQRGVDHGNAGRNAAARRALTGAQQRTTDPDLQARIAGTLSYIAARTGDPDGAERLCHEALTADGVSPATAAILAGQLGALAVQRGAYDSATRWLDQAIAELGDDPVHRGSMLMNRSVAYMQTGQLSKARADLRLAIEDFELTAGPVDVAMARHNLGFVLLVEGDLIPALAEMTNARPIIAGTSPVNAAISDLDRAEVLRDAGLVTEAERTLAEVAQVFGAHRMRQARGEAEFNLARSLLLHDPARAAKVAGAAVRRFRALGSESWAARAEGVRLRAELGRRLDHSATGRQRIPAADAVEAAAVTLDRVGFASEAAAVRLTRELWEAHHGATAMTAHDPGSSPEPGIRPPGSPGLRVPRGAPLQVRLLAHQVRAARAAADGHDAEVRRHAVRGLDALATRQNAFGSLDLQTSLAVHGTGLIAAGVAAALRSRRPATVFEWSERARHLSQRVVPLRPPPDPELAEDLAELRALRTEDPAWLTSPQALARQERARHRQWVSTGAAGLAERVSLAELRGSLDADTAFVGYVFDGREFGCLVVTEADARLVEAPDRGDLRSALTGLRADLDVSASVRSGPMAAVVARTLEGRLDDLARMLTAPPLAVAGDRRLVLTAPGALAGVPWPMLPGLRGRPLTLATSATNWVRDRGRVPGRVVGFAAGPGVARGEEEVRLAASSWPDSTSLIGGAASVDAVTELAGGVGVLHLAAHGRHSVDNPLFSGLELADGTLFGYDIDQMPRVPDVVVLSACELGRSTIRWGEEAIGMTRAWLHAGTACVVATPVVVADDLACELLGAMHAELAAGRPPAEALARASVRTGVTAPFQCNGSGF